MTRTIKRPDPVSGDINAAVAAERLRIMGIIGSDEGRRNPELAMEYADAGLDVETAKRFLTKAPAANPYLAAAMDREGPIGLNATVTEIAGDSKAARMAEIKEGARLFNNQRRRAQGLPELKD